MHYQLDRIFDICILDQHPPKRKGVPDIKLGVNSSQEKDWPSYLTMVWFRVVPLKQVTPLYSFLLTL